MRKLGLILIVAHMPLHVIMPAADLLLHAGMALLLFPRGNHVPGR